MTGDPNGNKNASCQPGKRTTYIITGKLGPGQGSHQMQKTCTTKKETQKTCKNNAPQNENTCTRVHSFCIVWCILGCIIFACFVRFLFGGALFLHCFCVSFLVVHYFLHCPASLGPWPSRRCYIPDRGAEEIRKTGKEGIRPGNFLKALTFPANYLVYLQNM